MKFGDSTQERTEECPVAPPNGAEKSRGHLVKPGDQRFTDVFWFLWLVQTSGAFIGSQQTVEGNLKQRNPHFDDQREQVS